VEEEQAVVAVAVTEDDTLWSEEDSTIWFDEEPPPEEEGEWEEAGEEGWDEEDWQEEVAAGGEQEVEAIPETDVAEEEREDPVAEDPLEEVEMPEEIPSEEPAIEEEARVAQASPKSNYYYDPAGRRDPFQAVSPDEGSLVLDVNSLTLIGTIVGPQYRLALLKDRMGFGYVMKPGDPVADGRVAAVTEDAAVFELVQFGAVSRVTLSLGVQTE
jgi:hypothetical protein